MLHLTRTRIAAAAALLVALAASASGQSCGDCDLSNSVDILDTLLAAQVDAQIRILSPSAFAVCDVDGNATVNIVDALRISQFAAQILPVLPCGGPSIVVVTPVGIQSGNVTVAYQAVDQQSDPLDLLVSFSLNGGAAWSPATPGPGGSGTSGVASSPAGVSHTYVWDSLADAVGIGVPATGVRIRLEPFDPGPGLAGISSGFTVSNSLDQMDPGPPLAQGVARKEHLQITLVDGRVLICGGTTDGIAPTARAELFDPVTQTFTQVGDMTTPRLGHVGVALPGGNAWVAGGASDVAGAVILSSVEYFSGATGTWAASPVSLLVPTFEASAVYFQSRNEILITGGVDDQGSGPVLLNDAQRFVPNAATPSAGAAGTFPSCRFARYDQTLTLLPGLDSVIGTGDDEALVYGGSGQDPASPPSSPIPGQSLVHGFHCLGDGEIFSPATGIWYQITDNSYYENQIQFEPSPPDAGPRRNHRAVLLGDGSVLLVGGENYVDQDPATGAPELPGNNLPMISERFVPTYGNRTASLINAAGQSLALRQDPEATLLLSGRVLVTGGYDGRAGIASVLATTEIFDPVSQSYTWAASLATDRIFHRQSLLPSGRVLIVGGEDDGFAVLSSTELYTP